MYNNGFIPLRLVRSSKLYAFKAYTYRAIDIQLQFIMQIRNLNTF